MMNDKTFTVERGLNSSLNCDKLLQEPLIICHAVFIQFFVCHSLSPFFFAKWQNDKAFFCKSIFYELSFWTRKQKSEKSLSFRSLKSVVVIFPFFVESLFWDCCVIIHHLLRLHLFYTFCQENSFYFFLCCDLFWHWKELYLCHKIPNGCWKITVRFHIMILRFFCKICKCGKLCSTLIIEIK